jgi:hypothetical protein
MLDLSTIPLFVMMALPTLGRVISGLRFFLERLSLPRRLP